MPQAKPMQRQEVATESVDIPGTALRVSRVALGTWAMGGWMWGGTDERESVATIRAALHQGINLIDTAPVYGFGVSEEIVGRAVAATGLRSQAVIATKVGLEWRNGKVYRNATRDRIMREIDQSLLRLRTDHRRQQFLGRANGALPPDRASARVAAALQPIRTSHRIRYSPLLPREQHCHSWLRRTVSRLAERPDARGDDLRRR